MKNILKSVLVILLLYTCNSDKKNNLFKIITNNDNIWVFMPLKSKDIKKVEFNSKYIFKNDFTYEDVGILKGTNLGNGEWKYDESKNKIYLNSQFYYITFFSNDSIVLKNKTENAILLNTKILKKLGYNRQ